jgi:7-carboxy-7-deazaguanine synthase
MRRRIVVNELPVMEQFLTLQGEGFHSGKSAVFIRLAGCDVGCVWCDVKESWDEKAHPVLSVSEIVKKTLNYRTDFVVITGGEPTLHDLSFLVDSLKKHDKYVAIETAGTNPLPDNIDWVCFSPKKFKKPHPGIYQKVNELKVVIYHSSDLEWAMEHSKKVVNKDAHLFIQPEWSRSDEHFPLVLSFLNENPSWRLSLQTHKFLNIP